MFCKTIFYLTKKFKVRQSWFEQEISETEWTINLKTYFFYLLGKTSINKGKYSEKCIKPQKFYESLKDNMTPQNPHVCTP